MKLTKTQLNFRKQMKNYEEEPNIYDTTRKGNPFSDTKKHKVPVGRIISALFLVPLIFGIIHHFALTTVKPENSSIIPVTNVTAGSLPVTNNSLKSNVSKTDAASLSQLQAISREINNNLQSLNEQHTIPWNQRNITTYKSVLLNGMATCEKENQFLSWIKFSSPFQPLTGITRNLILNSNTAYSHYLNYVNNQNPNEINLGNKYLQLVNQNNQEYIPTLVKILEDNNYNYSFNGTTVQYSIDNN